MGNFSCLCKGCHHPLLSPFVIEKNNGWMCDAVVLEKNGSIIIGEYDGYGSVGERDCFENGDPVAYHNACWTALGKPKYDGKRSEGAADQGVFFDDNVHNELRPKTAEDVKALRAKEDKRLKASQKRARAEYAKLRKEKEKSI